MSYGAIRYGVKTYQITKDGLTLNNHEGGSAILWKIKNRAKESFIEGRAKGSNPPTLCPEIRDINNTTCSPQDEAFDSVEQVFKHKNLMEVGGYPSPPALSRSGEPNRLDNPPKLSRQ